MIPKCLCLGRAGKLPTTIPMNKSGSELTQGRSLALKVILAISFALSGCASALNEKNAQRYTDDGEAQLRAGNYAAAAELYYRADINADLAGSADAARSMTRYNYGHSMALIGEFQKGEEALLESLALQRRVTSNDRDFEVLRRLSVLARIMHDTERPVRALPFYKEALDLAVALDLQVSYPGDIAQMANEARACAVVAAAPMAEQEFGELLRSIEKEHGEGSVTSGLERFTPAAVERRTKGPSR